MLTSMVISYELVDGKLKRCPDYEGVVLDVVNPSEAERTWLVNEGGISSHNINSALDPDEIGRLELEDDHLSMIVKTPKNYSSADNLIFRVTSMGVFIYKDRLIILSGREDPATPELEKASRLRDLQDILLKVISGTIAHFLGHLKVINMLTDSLEEKVNTSMANEHHLSMFKIEKSLVYYLNGINSNTVVMEKLKMHAKKVGLKDEHLEYLDDIIIDNSQCNKQAEIYSNILTGLMEARGSIVNNNLNLLIKRLTIVSVVFMPLNVLASMGGMSEFSSWTAGIPWWIAFSMFAGGLCLVAWITYLVVKRYSGDTPHIKHRKRWSLKRP